MIKIIVGKKGTGKTKILLKSIDEAAERHKGNVVFIDQTDKRRFDLNHQIRLVDVLEYKISGPDQMYGLFAGLLAGNYDISDIYMDATLRIIGRDYDKVGEFLARLDELTKEINVVMTISEDVENLPESVTKYIA